MIRFFRAALLALMLVPAAATAQDFAAGLAAEQAGDFATAVRKWTPLAEQGDALAQHSLGLMYAQGRGVPQDAAEAVKWYRLAAEQGHWVAQFSLGTIYAQGQGVPQDYAEAVKWFQLAAKQGYALAQLNIGFMYRQGRGVPQDFGTAHMWFNLSAAYGTADAANARDALAQKMSPAEITEAQRRARVCFASTYQDCD